MSEPSGGGRRPRSTTVVVVGLAAAIALPGCSRSQGSEEAYCRQLRQTPALATTLNGFADDDPAEVRTRVADARTAFAALEKAAPKEVRHDTETVVALVDAVLDAVVAHKGDAAATASQVREVVRRHPDAATAARNVSTYASQHCSVTLNPTIPS